MSTIAKRHAPVKPHRRTQRPAAPFAAGLYAPLPPEPEAPAMPRRVRWSVVDLAPLAESDAEWDERAAEAAALDAMERGLIPWDTAEAISRTSCVGHRP